MRVRPIASARRGLSTLAAAGTIWVASCGTQGPQPAATSPAVSTPPALVEDGGVASRAPGPTRAEAKDEVELLNGMVDRHVVAAMLGETCLEKAVHDELRSSCASTMDTLGHRIRTLQSTGRERYGVAHEPEMTPGMQRQMDRLSALAGAEFEVELLEATTRNSMAAVHEGRRCVENARDPELIGLCQDVVSAHLAGVARLQAWLCSWYGRC